MGSSRTGLDLEDKILWPWPWPWRPLALASTMRGLSFGFKIWPYKTWNFWVGLWLISKGLNTINTILHVYTSTRGGSRALNLRVGQLDLNWTDRRRAITALCVASRGKKPRDVGPRRLDSTSSLDLEDKILWPWPWRPLALALASSSTMLSSNTSLVTRNLT